MNAQADHKPSSEPPAWERANRHPLRRKTYALYLRSDKPLAPKDIAVILFGRNHSTSDLSKVSYHVRELLKFGVIELVAREPIRGSVKSFYRPTEAARLDGYALLDQLAEVVNEHTKRGGSNPRRTLAEIAALLRTSGRSVGEADD